MAVYVVGPVPKEAQILVAAHTVGKVQEPAESVEPGDLVPVEPADLVLVVPVEPAEVDQVAPALAREPAEMEPVELAALVDLVPVEPAALVDLVPVEPAALVDLVPGAALALRRVDMAEPEELAEPVPAVLVEARAQSLVVVLAVQEEWASAVATKALAMVLKRYTPRAA